MSDRKCESCTHFVKWNYAGLTYYYDRNADGVCTAPRPMLGPQPNREVSQNSGKGCPMWFKGESHE